MLCLPCPDTETHPTQWPVFYFPEQREERKKSSPSLHRLHFSINRSGENQQPSTGRRFGLPECFPPLPDNKETASLCRILTKAWFFLHGDDHRERTKKIPAFHKRSVIRTFPVHGQQKHSGSPHDWFDDRFSFIVRLKDYSVKNNYLKNNLCI